MEVPRKELLEKIKIEINEDEGRKRQSLVHFKEWIAKHSFIRKCRQGVCENLTVKLPLTKF